MIHDGWKKCESRVLICFFFLHKVGDRIQALQQMNLLRKKNDAALVVSGDSISVSSLLLKYFVTCIVAMSMIKKLEHRSTEKILRTIKYFRFGKNHSSDGFMQTQKFQTTSKNFLPRNFKELWCHFFS